LFDVQYDARAVSNFFLSVAEESGKPLSLLSLMKLVFFAHGQYLAHSNHSLVKQRFEAWENGPVCRPIWDAFKGLNIIPAGVRAFRFNPLLGSPEPIDDEIALQDCAFIRQIYQDLAHFPAVMLVDMTHAPGSPWHDVWRKAELEVSLGLPIDNEAIRTWFLRYPRRH
jgi:uncharacterized phage-associated protein